MSKARNQMEPQQRKEFERLAREVIASFVKGIVSIDEALPTFFNDNGMTLFEGYAVRYTDEYLSARREFTKFAASKLKAKYTHEKTIHKLCTDAGQDYVKLVANADKDNPQGREEAAMALIDSVLAEGLRKYVHIEPNFLVRHAAPDTLTLGRVRSMRTEFANRTTPLSKHKKIVLTLGNYPEQLFKNGVATIGMPTSIWLVDVSATKENVIEEAKWLIDIAISLMRLCSNQWQGNFPSIGKVEPHPTYPTDMSKPHITMEGQNAHTGALELPGWYEITSEIAAAFDDPIVKSRAALLFDPSDRSLAQRVAQGLGWMSRGRQASDRSERLLYFFTAFEALFTSNDKNDPVTQTISRFVSVIYTQNIATRVAVYDHIKGLYALRSSTIHEGRREVMWNDVNALQVYSEAIFWIVLNRCDLSMTQETFTASLRDASHGLPWKFAASKNEIGTE